MMWDGHDGMGWWMLWGGMLWIVFLVAFGFLVAWAAGRMSGNVGPARRADPETETPLAIARRRYANGDIGRDEFEQLKRDLQ